MRFLVAGTQNLPRVLVRHFMSQSVEHFAPRIGADVLAGDGDTTPGGVPLSEPLTAVSELQERALQGAAQKLAVVELPPAVERAPPGTLQICGAMRVCGPHVLLL